MSNRNPVTRQSSAGRIAIARRNPKSSSVLDPLPSDPPALAHAEQQAPRMAASSKPLMRTPLVRRTPLNALPAKGASTVLPRTPPQQPSSDQGPPPIRGAIEAFVQKEEPKESQAAPSPKVAVEVSKPVPSASAPSPPKNPRLADVRPAQRLAAPPVAQIAPSSDTAAKPQPAKPTPQLQSAASAPASKKSSPAAQPRKPLSPGQIAALSGTALEKPFSGIYVNEFPTKGTFVCARCNSIVASAGSKVRGPYGFAAFERYFVSHLIVSLLSRLQQTRMLVHCANCEGFIGEISDADCLFVNSFCVRHVAEIIHPTSCDSTFESNHFTGESGARGENVLELSSVESEADADEEMFLDDNELRRKRALRWARKPEVHRKFPLKKRNAASPSAGSSDGDEERSH